MGVSARPEAPTRKTGLCPCDLGGNRTQACPSLHTGTAGATRRLLEQGEWPKLRGCVLKASKKSPESGAGAAVGDARRPQRPWPRTATLGVAAGCGSVHTGPRLPAQWPLPSGCHFSSPATSSEGSRWQGHPRRHRVLGVAYSALASSPSGHNSLGAAAGLWAKSGHTAHVQKDLWE